MEKRIKIFLMVIVILNLNGCKCNGGSDNNTGPSAKTISFQSSGVPVDKSVYLKEVLTNDDKITLSINVKGGKDVYGASLEIVYDGNKISFNSCSVAGNYLGINAGDCIAKLYQDKQGILLIGISKTGKVSGKDGDGLLTNVIFKALITQSNTTIGFNTTNSVLKSSDKTNPNIPGITWFGGSLSYQ